MKELKVIKEEIWKEGQGKSTKYFIFHSRRWLMLHRSQLQVGSLSVLFQGELMLMFNSESGSANKLNFSYPVADA